MPQPRHIDPEGLIEYARRRYRLEPAAPTPAGEQVLVADPGALPAPPPDPPSAPRTAEELYKQVEAVIGYLETLEDWPPRYGDERTASLVMAVRAVVARTTRKGAPRIGRSKIARGRRNLLAQALPARPRRRSDADDAIDAIRRILDLRLAAPDLVGRGISAYLANISRSIPAPLFRDLPSAGDYVAFLHRLGHGPNQVIYWFCPPQTRGELPSLVTIAAERYWLEGLEISQLHRRPPIQTTLSNGYLAIGVTQEDLPANAALDTQRRGYDYRFGVFAIAVEIELVRGLRTGAGE